MDIDIVNSILRLCIEQQTCLFEISFLCDYCVEQRLCTNSKYVLASIKNYMEIFKINRVQNQIEFFMPFDICRHDGISQNKEVLCSNFHVCYNYFYTNSCRRLSNCPYPHDITVKHHENILGSLINLDLDALSKAFRVYCQSKKPLVNHNSSKGQQQPTPATTKNTTPSSSLANNWRLTTTPQISTNSSWKTNHQPIITSRTLPKPQTAEKGLQICWKPSKDIQAHFIEVIFSNQSKSNGGPMRTHQVYQHFGIAQVFYQNADIADRVILHGPVTFQSFTFTSHLLQRTIDMRHVCFSNMPIETNHIASYIDTVSTPYTKVNFDYYQNDKQVIVVEYNENIDFSKIFSNVRNHPECHGSMINCIQLYRPQTLFVEYDQDYSEDDMRKIFDEKYIFHIKTYLRCSFVHFYSADDLAQAVNKTYDHRIRITPIYINIYSQTHLHDYLQRQRMKYSTKPIITVLPSVNETIQKVPQSLVQKVALPSESQPSIPILVPPPIHQQIEVASNVKLLLREQIRSPSPPKQTTLLSNCPAIVEKKKTEVIDPIEDDDMIESEDDFHDLPTEFDDDDDDNIPLDDLFLDESTENNGDLEFLRSAAKNLISSLAEMEAASSNTKVIDAPHSLLYGDDHIVTIKSRRFALAFLDYTQFRVEKQSNPDKFRLFASLRKTTNKKTRVDHAQQRDQTPSPTSAIETKTNKKKRNKRNKKKKNVNNTEKDNEIDLTI